MAGTVLLVDDEENLASLVAAYLEREGYGVVSVGSGAEALRVLGQQPVRLVVLDLALPDMDGLDVCRQIRTRSSVPVVMLTARDDPPDRLAGLAAGADDYIGKPFSPPELVARMKAVLRRAEPAGDEQLLVLDDVVLRRGGREVTVADELVELRPKEFDLLAYLIQNRGIVVSRDLLLERVWGFEYAGGTRTVDVHVAQLRRKLGRPALIRTIRGAGYKAVQP
ncbi:MAG: two-component system, OmpR family, response regulator ResD [Gaiellales bacterium]|jgi:DNA-binding response OmpR family regulator|nr:two-component system, OmpR family, response regulator ResD [Gaiellales bacterium]MDX6566720.1 two-component system, OmpR family, response regulator ResD [Gaiellales bacterium]